MSEYKYKNYFEAREIEKDKCSDCKNKHYSLKEHPCVHCNVVYDDTGDKK